jgi:hypothetical protein
VAATLDAIEESQKMMLDEKWPTGTVQNSRTVHMVEAHGLTEDKFEQMLQAVENRRK